RCPSIASDRMCLHGMDKQDLGGATPERKSLPNAAAICQQYFSFRRNASESIGNFLVRETLVHEEFVEAIIRLHEEKEGISQDQRDFGLPPASEEWDDDSWSGSWGRWNYDEDYDYPYDEDDADGSPHVDSPSAHGGGAAGAEETTASAAPGSSPSHGDRTPGGRVTTTAAGTQTDNTTAVNELSVTDSFIMGVLRGWRLLQAAALSAEEKRDILGATKNSLDYDTIANALQNLWDDQLLAGHRHRGGGDHFFNLTEQDDYEGFYQDEWWQEGEDWQDGYFADGYEAEDTWWPDDWSGLEHHQAEADLENPTEISEQLQEAQKAEQVAESLALEANRTWSEAHRAAQALRRDRGFGAVTVPEGGGKCFNCGGSHYARDCPHARPGASSKGFKGKGAPYTSDMFGGYYIGKGKGKGKNKGKKGMWLDAQAWTRGKGKAKSKGKEPSRSVNAYSADYFMGGLELSEGLDLNSADVQSRGSRPQVGMLDCGATASAAPEAVVQGLITAVLAVDKGARIELDQTARPYFRFGNGKWGRAVCRTTISSQASGQHQQFSLYTLPNPPEYYQSHFDKSTLVPSLIGMDYLGAQGVGMMIDFATGLAMKTKEPQPKIFKLDVNHKGSDVDVVSACAINLFIGSCYSSNAEAIIAASMKAKAKPKQRPRLLYTPRKGAPANTTATVNAATVTRMLTELHQLLGETRHGLHEPTGGNLDVNIAHEYDLGNGARERRGADPGVRERDQRTVMRPIGVDDKGAPLYIGKKLMAMAAMMTAATASMLVGLHLEGRDGLWEVTCAPHTWMSQAAEEHGLQPRRIDRSSGYDLYKAETWEQLRLLRRRKWPKKLWFSLPYTKWDHWAVANSNTEEKKDRLDTARRKERRLLWYVNQFIKEAIKEDDEVQVDIYFEWPHPGTGWRQQPMVDLEGFMQEQVVPWLSCRVDGCVYGMKEPMGQRFLKKSWMIKTTDEKFHRVFRAKVCRGQHGHHQQGDEGAATSFYPWKMVQSITRHWRDQLAPERHVRLLQQREDQAALIEEFPVEGADVVDVGLLDEEPSTELGGDDEELEISAASAITVEAVAREAVVREQYDASTLQSILLELRMALQPSTTSSRRWKPSTSSTTRVLLGGYSHGAFFGICKTTMRFPEVTKYINHYLRRHAPQHSWSSVLVGFNSAAVPHRDHHNLKNSSNLIHGVGDYEDGGLWLEGEPPHAGIPCARRRLPDGHQVKGYVLPTRGKFVFFDPEQRHATQAWRGLRMTLSAYTTPSRPYMEASTLRQLRELGFALEPSTTTQTALIMTTATTSAEESGSTSEPTKEELERWQAKVAKFHKAAGHPTNRNLAKIIKDAGHQEWRVRVALEHVCPTCQSLRQGGTSSGQIPPAATRSSYRAWAAVGADVGEWVPPGSKQKVKFVLFMDLATKLRVVQPLYKYGFLEMRTETADDVLKACSERWLGTFPKPDILILDAAKTFAADTVHDFCHNLNIQVSFVAEKEAWAHGALEAGVQDVKMTASAIHMEERDQDPFITLYLSASALNSTEYTAGYSSFQWAFGREYTLNDEDVRTFSLSNYKDEFAKLVTARENAEAVATRPVTTTEQFVYETSGEECDIIYTGETGEFEFSAGFITITSYNIEFTSGFLTITSYNIETPDTGEVTNDTEDGGEVNDYSLPDKRQKLTDWVSELYTAVELENNHMDIFTAFQECNEFLQVTIDLEAPQSNRQRKALERHPVAYLVKKMKDAEVSIAKLPAHERVLFERAKMKEVDSFIKNEAVRRCLDTTEVKKAYESQRIVRARWVLTWKLTPTEDMAEAQQDRMTNESTVYNRDGTRKAKARIVLLGFEHPNLLDPAFKTASPVQSTVGRNLLYSLAAHHQWQLEGLDLATAFLQTQATEADKEIWTSGVKELREALGVGEEGIIRILRNIYGSTTAPRGLWLDLHKTLTALGGQPVPGERCLWIFLSKTEKDGNHPLLRGAMGGHVDDFHRVGDDSGEWRAIKEAINKAYKWGMTKSHNYRHAGTDVATMQDDRGYMKIVVNQDYYAEGIPDLDIEPARLRSDEPLGRKDLKRKAIGSNDAEVQAMLEAEDQNFRTRLLWAALHGAGGHDTQKLLRTDWVENAERIALRVKGILCTDSKGGYDAVELNESPLLGLSNMRAALQAFQLRDNLRRASGELRWVASDFDLGDALTKKKAECRVGLVKFLRTGRWCIRYDPNFVSAKKNKRAGRSAVSTIDKALGHEAEQLTLFGGDAACYFDLQLLSCFRNVQA
ncbi:unnamed protein product, partial [Symbiodinium microadriaticum]